MRIFRFEAQVNFFVLSDDLVWCQDRLPSGQPDKLNDKRQGVSDRYSEPCVAI